MLGKVRRPSMSSLEQLELERSPPKIIKDDPLSIYENTLRKLEEGSQRCQRLPPEDAIREDNSHISSSFSHETIDPDSSANSSLNSNVCQSTSFSEEERSRNVSVLYLFSKYTSHKNVHKNVRSSHDEAMVIENACSSSSISANLNHYQFVSSSEQLLQENCYGSLVSR